MIFRRTPCFVSDTARLVASQAPAMLNDAANAVIDSVSSTASSVAQSLLSIVSPRPDSATLFYRAMKDHNFDEARRLIGEKDFDPNATVFNHTPLNWAILFKQNELIKLLANNADIINKPNKQGVTALHLAVETNNQAAVEMLIASGAKPEIPDKNGDTALHKAVLHRDAKMVELLTNKETIDKQNESGMTALHLAVQSQQKEIVKLLLSKRANLDIQDKSGMTALHWATFKEDIEMVKLLIYNNDANINIRDNGGATVLFYAIESRHNALSKLIIREGANLDIPNIYGLTALHVAVINHEKDVVELLLEKQANIDKQDKGGYSALHKAVMHGDKEMVELLLRNNSNINLQSYDGTTALHRAIQYGEKEIVELLLRKNAKLYLVDYLGKTPLASAFETENLDMINLLLEKGTKEIDPYLLIKSAGLILGLKDSIKYNGIDFDFEGADRSFGLFIMKEGLKAFLKEMTPQDRAIYGFSDQDIHSFLDPFENAFFKGPSFDPSMKEKIMERIRRNQPVCIMGGTNGHSIGIIIWKDEIAVCNRGFGMQGDAGVTFYHSDHGITDDIVAELLKIHPNIESFNAIFTPKFLGEKGGIARKGPPQKPQKVGNCTLASAKESAFALFDMMFGKEKAGEFYKNFTAFLRHHTYVMCKGKIPGLDEQMKQKLAPKLKPEHPSYKYYSKFKWE